MDENDIKLSLRLKYDKLVLKLGNMTKELAITDDLSDEVTQLARILMERRKEVLDKRRREMLQDIRNARKGSR